MSAEEELPDFSEEAEETVVAQPVEERKKTYTAIHASGFKDMLLKAELNRAIVESGFEHPSEVQHECIPQAVLGTDILCQAKSGMGKTAVFVLATLQQIETGDKSVKVIVVCHARELAIQIKSEYDRFAKFFDGITCAAVFGGVDIQKDKQLLQGDNCPQIVVCTPGRCLQLLREGALNLDKVAHFVLDECDRCLEKADMRKDIQSIFVKTPKRKQVMMFSATMSDEMKALCKRFMKDPHEITVDDQSKLTLHGLLQYYVQLEEREKNRKLTDLLDVLEFNQVVVFVKSVARATALDDLLNDCNFPSICIHSGLKQEERSKRFREFKDFKRRLLVATDLFGRGIDIEKVNIVINYDFPSQSDQYLHRVGRAGRFGTKGLAISLVSGEEDRKTLGEVRERFGVQIDSLPESVDASSYMNA